LGIVVTALLMGISFKETKMTDQEIIARAKQLGMVESTTLAEDAQKQLEQMEENKAEENKTEEKVSEEPKEEIVTEEIPAEELTGEETPQEEIREEAEDEENVSLEEKLEEELLGIRETGDEEDGLEEEISEEIVEETVEETEEPEETETTESYVLEIRSGDTSVSVSKRLVELGIIEDATEYDVYLCQNGYDKKICTGTYEIMAGATYEEIAKIITKRN